MSEIGLEILVILLLVLVNAIFAAAETAVVTARKSLLTEWADEGMKRAATALQYAKTPTPLLATLQIGILLVAIVLGAIGSGDIADRIAASLTVLPWIEPYNRMLAVTIVVALVGFLLIVIGQLIPRRLAARYPEKTAALVARPMRLLMAVFSPFVDLANVSADAVFRLFGSPHAAQPPVTEEEIKILVQKGTEAGVFEQSEQSLVEAVFTLGDRTARSLMTPRSQIAWLDLSASDQQIRAKIKESRYSRYPVSTGDLDHVIGVVQAKDLLARHLAGQPLDLKSLLQEPLFVPRTISALHVLEIFKQSGKHIALVVDEYGGIGGLLTHHDILQAIAGEIPFGEQPTEPKSVRRHDGSWLLDGMLAVEEFKEIFDLESLPGEKKDAYQTLGGFLFTQMGRVPAVADRYVWGRLRFEIVDMDGKRIDKVLVMPMKKMAEGDESLVRDEAGDAAERKD